MRVSIVVAVAACALTVASAAESALDIVKRSLDLQERNFDRGRDYVYQERQTVREIDGSGKVKSTKVQTFDVLRLYGRPYMRLIEKDGKPLSAADEHKQEENLRKEMEKRRKEKEDPNSKERRELEKREQEFRQLVRDVQEAFTFKLTGEDRISGKPSWIIDAEPKPGYRPRSIRASIYPKMRGRLWIDEAEYQWVKVEAEALDTISFGLFLFRVAKGSSFRFEQRRVNDEVWLPSHTELGLDAKLALMKRFRAGIEITYSNYRKFQTDSKVVSTEPVP